MDKGDIVVHCQFAQHQLNPHVNIKQFVAGYMFRPEACEPLVLHQEQQSQYIKLLTTLNAPYDRDANKILNNRLRCDGIGFDKDNLTMNRNQQLALANQAQSMYQKDHSIRQIVISFRTDYLKQKGVIDNDADDLGRGSFRGRVDQRKLRSAVQDGMNRYFDQSTMKDPQFAAAIQTDTDHVHVHLSVWDNDKHAINDHGMVAGRERAVIKSGINDSLDQQPNYVNEVNGLQSLAQLTQQQAQFKHKLLERELYNSALRLDKVSLSTYVDNLAEYDQRTLSDKERNQLANKIKHDYEQNGQLKTNSHRLTYGQCHIRRQVHAMVRSRSLRQYINLYQRSFGMNQANQQSRVVYEAAKFEAKRQLMINEKYRLSQRTRVNAIYLNHQGDLNKRRQQLLKDRKTLLPQVATHTLRPGYVNRLLNKQTVMANLQKQLGNTPLTKTKVYQDLNAARDDDTHVLSPLTIKLVAHSVPKEQQPQVQHELVRNQTFNVNDLTPAKRLRIAEYEQELTDYEFSAVSYGGLGVNEMQFNNPDDHLLKIPSETKSIYSRPNRSKDPELMSVDFDQIVKSGPLKPAIHQAVRKSLSKRYRALNQAHQYFAHTGQANPTWLTEAAKTLRKQYQIVNDQTGPTVVNNKLETSTGYELSSTNLPKLVNRHIQDVSALER